MDILNRVTQEKEFLMHSTVNQFENSVTVLRPDSTKIDFCHVPSLNEFIVGQTTGVTGDNHTQIVLSIPEARELQNHLSTVLG
jgi:hypothetical protein